MAAGAGGIVLGMECSRLARNNADWQRLLQICAHNDTLILDEDGLYDPTSFNDRLLLGLSAPVRAPSSTSRNGQARLLSPSLTTRYLPVTDSVGRGRMSVCVQAIQLPGGDRTWTVLGNDQRHVGPVEEFLEHHRVTGSSPHTVRAYAKALQLWWHFLELDGRDWTQAAVPELAGFVTWLREGTPPAVVLLDPAAAAGRRPSEATLATRLAAVVVLSAVRPGCRKNPPRPATATPRLTPCEGGRATGEWPRGHCHPHGEWLQRVASEALATA